ncbi:hypothetical protein CYLTODRAFT_489999 [Cylindrobasidium torrendii FP15055 ss-10]|uniref:Uncharacterized protein n=1 Tax=Cylindrobasidium torrendii FP15055 ss-10 TaxID=1314674 RepID=A0A0D7BCD9_9AGAR|nr:hypothetical protein CYLTODRAFT_489999 [Cylindrobasidium torrendii FP15055 ss-10]
MDNLTAGNSTAHLAMCCTSARTAAMIRLTMAGLATTLMTIFTPPATEDIVIHEQAGVGTFESIREPESCPLPQNHTAITLPFATITAQHAVGEFSLLVDAPIPSYFTTIKETDCALTTITDISMITTKDISAVYSKGSLSRDLHNLPLVVCERRGPFPIQVAPSTCSSAVMTSVNMYELFELDVFVPTQHCAPSNLAVFATVFTELVRGTHALAIVRYCLVLYTAFLLVTAVLGFNRPIQAGDDDR